MQENPPPVGGLLDCISFILSLGWAIAHPTREVSA